MAVSPITPITLEGQPEELSSFLRAGVMYVLWSSPLNDTGLRRLRWKPHTSGDFTEVVPDTAFAFHEATTLYHPATDELVVIWDDSQAISQQQNGKLFYARFNVLTGALVAGPVELFPGSSPRLSYATRPDREGAWSSGPNMVNARIAPALSALNNGDIIVTGGDDSPTPGPVFNTDKVERINFAGTTTTALTAMNYRRSYHSQVTLGDDSVFVIGGNQGGPVPHKAEVRHPVTGLWTLTPSVPTSAEAMLYNVACTVLPDGRVAVFGGDADPNGGSLVTKALHHVFNPTTNTWVDMGTPALTPASAVLLTLPDGRVLRVGGYTRSAPFAARVYTSTAEIWNPATSSWSSVTGTGLAAAQQASVRLNDGTFLVFGGYAGTPGTGPLATFLYTPDTGNGSWKTVGNLPVPLLAGGQGATNMAAVVMDDGGVIAIGTNDPTNVPLSKVVAYYDPILQTWSEWVDLPAFYGEAVIARLNGNRVIHLGGDEDDLYVFSNATRVVTGPPERVMMLYYLTVKSGGVYGHASIDGGVSWQSGEPIVTNQVLGSTKLEVVPYDASHVSIAQLGQDPKGLAEIGSFTRTRPLVSIVKHPSVANTFFIGEPSKFDNVTLIDNLRGGLVLATDNSKLFHLDGAQQGSSDGLSAVTLLGVTGTVFTPSSVGHAVGVDTRFLWRLDESSGTATVVDATGTYDLPTAVGVPVAEAGKINNGRHFNNSTMEGASDAATVSKFARAAGNWTLGFWIKIPSVDTGSTTRGVMTLCEGGNINTAVFYLKTAFGGLYMGSTTAGNSATGILFTGLSGQWVHCVLAWNGSTMKAWRNGVALADPAIGGPNPSTLTTPTWLLGKGQSTGFVGQDMVLDDVWFENTLWTTAQVQADFVAGSGSAGPAAGANGDDLVSYTLGPALSTLNVDLPGTSYAVALDVSSTHGYVAEYADNSGTAGQFVVVDLAAGTTGTVFSGVTGVRAVGVANFLTPPLIFVGSTESGAERLRVYEQNGLTPSLVLNTKLPARANAITVIPHPTLPGGARVLVSMADRFNIYDYTSGAAPVTLLDSYRFSGGGKFFRSKVATNGNIVVAAGDAGVLVLNPTGKVLAQIQLSSKVVDEWVPSKVYALNQLVRPRDRHQFARSRYFFKVTNVGAGAATSGTSEPDWTNAPPLTVVYDPISPPTAGNTNSLQWTPQAVRDGIAVDVALDETAKRIYAVGNVGGDLGTDGRVWILNAAGLI